MFIFSFEAGSALIKNTDTGEVVVNQPFRATDAGQEPWASAEDAENFMRGAYPQYFPEPGPEPWSGPLPPEETYPAPEAPAESGQGE